MIRSAFEHVPQALAIYGLDGELRWVNEAYNSLYEVDGTWHAEELTGAFPRRLTETQKATLRTKRHLNVDFLLSRKADAPSDTSLSKRRTIGCELNAIISDEGEWEGFVGVFNDLTHVRQDQELRRRLLLATDLGEKVMMLTNSSGEIEYVNAAFLRSTGYSEKEVLGKNPRVFKSGLMHEEVYRRMWSSLQRGETWQGELLNRKKSGELFWEQAIITPVPGTAGEGQHYLAVKDNITERKLLRGRLEMLQGVMRVMSSESIFEKATPKLAKIIAEALAAGWVEIWVLDRAKEELCCLAGHETAGTLKRPTSLPKTGDRIKRSEDQRYMALDSLGHVRLNSSDARGVLAFPIRTEQGGSGLLILGDLVNTASVLPALELVCAQLGHFLQRTRMESEILHAKDIAEAASRAKSAFLSNMSHELRTPLNAILGLSQLMAADQGLAPAQQKQVASIERSGLELLSLINAILDISRVVSTSALQHSALNGLSTSEDQLASVRRLLETEDQPGSTAPSAVRDVAIPFQSGPHSRPAEILLGKIHDFAARADIDSLNRMIDELAMIEAPLAMTLKQHAELYDYETILSISAKDQSNPRNRQVP